MSLLWYWCWLLLIILDAFIGRNVRVDWFTFFVIYHTVCNLISSQYVTVFLVGPLFPFPWFSGGCAFLGSVFSWVLPCVLVNFPGLGAASLVCSGGRLLYRCSFHFRREWKLLLLLNFTKFLLHILKPSGSPLLLIRFAWHLIFKDYRGLSVMGLGMMSY